MAYRAAFRWGFALACAAQDVERHAILDAARHVHDLVLRVEPARDTVEAIADLQKGCLANQRSEGFDGTHRGHFLGIRASLNPLATALP